jgi:hypothetical protein
MALVGHESAAMSHRYTHVGKEALARARKNTSRNLKIGMIPHVASTVTFRRWEVLLHIGD